MRRALFVVVAVAMLSSLLVSCGSTVATTVSPQSISVPVSLTMTDDPPSGVAVLFFQVSLTSASLQPAVGTGPSISLLNGNTAIQIDVTQLQALSAFLNTANVPPGTYGSLSLTFANPQLVILNQSDTALGSSCAVGSICTLTPAIDNSATVNFASAPFPVAVTDNSPLGFLIDFHLNTVIQSDMTVNLGATNGITLAQLPAAVSPAAPPFGFLTGTVGSVNTSQNQFTLGTAWGKTFTVDVNSSTVFADWPPCASPGTLTCLTPGAIVQIQVGSVQTDGSLLAAKVIWLSSGATNQQIVEGTVVWFNATQIKLILHNSIASSAALPLGGIALVTLDTGTVFSVDSGGFTIPSGSNFSSFQNLTSGQNLKVAIDPGTMSCLTSTAITVGSWGPPPVCTFSTNNVQLEPSQISGTVASISSPSFTVDYLWSPCAPPGGTPVCNVVALIQTPVETTLETTYEGFNPDNFSGLADNDFVSVNGWLFENDNGILGTPVTPSFVLAQTVTLHTSGIF